MQLIPWLRTRYLNCRLYTDFEGEIISLVEQGIVASGREFLRWPKSSWSSRIIDLRRFRKVDESPYTKKSLLDYMEEAS